MCDSLLQRSFSSAQLEFRVHPNQIPMCALALGCDNVMRVILSGLIRKEGIVCADLRKL